MIVESGFGRRLSASVIDVLLILLLGVLIGINSSLSLSEFFFQGFLDPSVGLGPFENLTPIFGSLVSVILVSIVCMLMEGIWGTSPGKAVLRMNLQADDFIRGRFFIRCLIKWALPWTTFVAGISGVLMIASVGQIVGLIVLVDFFVVVLISGQGLVDRLIQVRVMKKIKKSSK